MEIKRYRDWQILSKIMTIPVIAMVVTLVCVEFLVIPFFHREIMEGKEAAVRNVVELGITVIEEHDAQVRAGRMTLAEAKRQSIEHLRRMRYDGKEYLWINDAQQPIPTMIMHPTMPALEGRVLDDVKYNRATGMRFGLGEARQSVRGKNLFAAVSEVCARAGHGFVTYAWPKAKGDGGTTSELYQKVSYVKKFAPWGWVLGSGVYVDYVDEEVAVLRSWAYGAALVFSLFLLALAAYVGRGITAPLSLTIRQLQDMTVGNADLTQRIAFSRRDESGVLAEAFNGFLDNLQHVISTIRDNASNVAQAAYDIKQRAKDLASGSQKVALDASSVATAGDEMAATALVIANNCVLASDASKETAAYAQEGAQVVQSTVSVMSQIADQVHIAAASVTGLGDRSNQIGDIIGTIEEIADQTNLLALNAAIEAARAGDQGRGFAVVAGEVRLLAERTTRATGEISEMIKSIQRETRGAVEIMHQGVGQVEAGTVKAESSGASLEQIRNQVARLASQIGQIANAAAEQTSTTTEISASIERITKQTENECDQAGAMADAAEKLNRLAESMISSVNRFQTIIKWNDWMTVKVERFDDAHKKLINMIGQLNDAMQHGQSEQVIHGILQGLADYCKEHFADEERYLEQHGYPASSEHKQVHVAFISKVTDIIRDYDTHEASPSQVMNLLSDWLMTHILKTDKKYTEHFLATGVIAA